MTNEVSVGQYLAIPYAPFIGNTAKNDVILEGCVNLPNLFPLPGTVEERRLIIASWLTKPEHLFWEVWRGNAVIGIIGLSHIIPNLDAKAHMAFFDRELWSRRTLIINLMQWAFSNLKLVRLSVEIPDHLEPLIRFCRVKLGFKYEGEISAGRHPKVVGLIDQRINGPARWVAKFGSRREVAHWDGTTWRDVVCLRVLKQEFELQKI